MTGYSWTSVVRVLPGPDRSQLAKLTGGAPDPERLGQALTDFQWLERQVRSASAPALNLLRDLCLAGGQVPVDQIYRADPTRRQAFNELVGRGLAVELRIDYYQRVVAVPLEAQLVAFETVVRPLVAARAHGRPLEPATLTPAPPWATDLFRLLSHLRWYDGPLTQRGEIYKRTRQLIERTFWPQHPVPVAARWDLIWRFAEWLGLIQADHLHRRVAVTTEAPSFFRRSPRERWQLWYEFWERDLLARNPLGHVVWDLLSAVPDYRLVSAAALKDMLAASAFVSEDRAAYAVTYVLTQGTAMSLIRQEGEWVGVSPDMAALAEDSNPPAPENRAVVQPTGEVVVPVETPLDVLWDAEAALTLVQSGVVWTYRVDAEAIDRALSEGLTADDVIARLAALSRVALPENVVTEIQDAWRRIDRVRVLDTVVVWADSPTLADSIAQGLGDLVRSRLGETLLVLGAADGDAAIKRLTKLGYAVRAKPEQPGAESARLVEPIKAEYRYVPQLQAALPHVPSGRSATGGEIEQTLKSAIRAHETIRVAYQRKSDPEPQVVHVYPVAVHGGMLHGVVQGEGRRPFQVRLADVIEVWRFS